MKASSETSTDAPRLVGGLPRLLGLCEGAQMQTTNDQQAGGRAAATAVANSATTDALQRYRTVRALSEWLVEPLVTEDYVIQSMDDVSPTKWHLGHVSWFFETFILQPELSDYEPFHPRYGYVFNSYYNAVGERHPRPRRGLLARPTVSDVMAYRAHVDQHMERLWSGLAGDDRARLTPLLEIGLHHEQQHQELMVTDFKHVFASNPLHPVYRERAAAADAATGARDGNGHAAAPGAQRTWVNYDGGLEWFGHVGDAFAYDNESPHHQRFLQPYRLASRPVSNGEYRQFIADGGYRRHDLWLSDGWDAVNQLGWDAPMYWTEQDGDWLQMTLSGLRPVADDEPVTHVSYFEADAYARWAGARLPTEFEWEAAAAGLPIDGNFVAGEAFHPVPQAAAGGEHPALQQMYGDVWEWTSSDYGPYPGYRPVPGALGEYNGKFMCNQYVLRGGSCATSRDHIRATYRNFFPPDKRWQFTGIRLADELPVTGAATGA